MADDFSGVTASLDQASYVQGAQAKLTVAGNVISDTTGAMGPLQVSVVNPADGATQTISVAAVPVAMKLATPAKMTAILDQGMPSRVWTISADGLTATATA